MHLFCIKTCQTLSLTQGTREAPPIISTKSICSTVTPAAVMADLAPSRTAVTRSIMGWHISRKASRVMVEPKSSSWICLKNSSQKRVVFNETIAVKKKKKQLLRGDLRIVENLYEKRPFDVLYCCFKGGRKTLSNSKELYTKTIAEYCLSVLSEI